MKRSARSKAHPKKPVFCSAVESQTQRLSRSGSTHTKKLHPSGSVSFNDPQSSGVNRMQKVGLLVGFNYQSDKIKVTQIRGASNS